MTTPPGGRKRRRASGRRGGAERPSSEQHAPQGQEYAERHPWDEAEPYPPQPYPPQEYAGRRAPSEQAPAGGFPVDWFAAGPSAAGPVPSGQVRSAGAAPDERTGTGEQAAAGQDPAGQAGSGRAAGRRQGARRSSRRDAGQDSGREPERGSAGDAGAPETAAAGRRKAPGASKARARGRRHGPGHDTGHEPEEEASIPWLAARGWSAAKQKRLLVTASVAGAVAAIGAFVLAVEVIGNDYVPERTAASAAGTEPRPDAYRGWPSSKVFEPITQRTADPRPLTVKDVFAEKTLTEGRLTLKLAGTRLDADCSAAVWGQALTGQLAQAGCTQALRGAYVSADRGYVAQYTLFNLRDTAAADALVKSLTSLHRGGWVRPLESAQVVFPADGHTEGSGHAMGHYAGLVWIARADGAEPGAKDDFVSLALAVRGAEKAVFRRVVAATPGS
ncbi:hypothetical protein ACFOWE_16710 [Planomonospora corallina]|uniref:Uncharacterized protein n=1 Tax=Planomonospora corallina TaxID=1806052 RepID=A0ABV8IAJ0_9ACTN